jgi:hypothetical protein
MKHTTFTRVRAAALTLALGGLLAVLAPASSASASDPLPPPPPEPVPEPMPLMLDVDVSSPGILTAGGAAVDVPVTVACSGRDGFLSLTLTQRVGNRIAQGSGWASVACVGQTQRLLLRVVAFGGGPAFRAKPALADASASACNDLYCFNDQASEVIDVRR